MKRVLVEVDDEGVVVEPESGRMFNLNDTGLFVYKLLERKTPEPEIVRLLADEFDVDPAMAADDVREFAKRFSQTFPTDD